MNKVNSTAALALGAFLVGSVATFGAQADANPFGVTELEAGYQVADEGKCGEGKCGGDKEAEGEGKCGEGKCGGDKEAEGEGKCGEGKCGG